MKPALIFLCQRVPYPPITGDRITSFYLLRHLSGRYRVFLGTFIDDPTDPDGIVHLRQWVQDIHADSVCRPWSLGWVVRWLRGDPVSFAFFRSRGLSNWLADVSFKHRPVAVVAHSSNMCACAVDDLDEGAQSLRRILHFADVDSEKFAAYSERAHGLRRWMYSTEARRVRREERRLAAAADAVAFVSDNEADLFRKLLAGAPGRVVTLPNGVDTDLFNPDNQPRVEANAQEPVFVFTGAMDYLPNIHAVEWFTTRVLPQVRLALPGAQFLIVGAKPTAAVKALSRNAGVTVTGRVESVVPFLARAHAAVAPLEVARGVQNKVLEAMAMARPVVASSAALGGIAARAGEHVIRADTPEEWINACVGLFRNPSLADRIGRAARMLVLQHYSWQSQFAKLDELLS